MLRRIIRLETYLDLEEEKLWRELERSRRSL